MTPPTVQFIPASAQFGTLMIANGYISTTIGSVEASVQTDGSTTSTYGFIRMEFRDGTKDGSWTDDGLGLLFDCGTTDYSDWVSLLPTSSGRFTITEEGTSTVVFTLDWTGSGVWTVGRRQRYGTSAVDYTGTVPANNDRVDVYFS